MFLERTVEIQAYRNILVSLADTALTAGQSRELIALWQPSCTRMEKTMMAAREPDSIVWRTSSHSGGSGNCVQVAPTPGRVLVRDSQDPGGPALDVPAPAWRAFLTTVTS